MSRVPTQVVIAAYHDESVANQITDAVKMAKMRGMFSHKLDAAAQAVKDEYTKLESGV